MYIVLWTKVERILKSISNFIVGLFIFHMYTIYTHFFNIGFILLWKRRWLDDDDGYYFNLIIY